MKTITQRELRNHASRILRQVEAGEQMRITVDGRPVADLVPIAGVRRTFVPIDEVLRLLARAPLDRKFSRDIEGAAGATLIVTLPDSAEF
jgi:prevent-host-death family protein